MKNQLHSLVRILGVLSFVTASYAGPILAPTLDTELDGTNSIVYCPTLQIAWDSLSVLVGSPIEMQKQDDLVQKLNNASCPTGTVPDEAHVAMAGYTDRGVISKLETALRNRFWTAAPALPAIFSDKRTEIVTYSYLCRNLPFPVKFVRSTEIPLKFRSGKNTHPVEFFGAPQSTADNFAKQVDILHYSGENDFVIHLSTRVKDEFIVLAKIPQPETLAAGVETVRTYLDAERKGMTQLKVNGKEESYMSVPSRKEISLVFR